MLFAPVLRTAAALTAIGLVVLALSSHLALREERAAQTAWLRRSGVQVDARLVRELAREPDPEGVRMRAARAVLASEMRRAVWLDPATAEGRAELRRGAALLEQTARRAGEVLAERPASWEAAMILGGATFQGWWQARDSRLFTSPEHWEEPLLAARRLAPAKREPLRFLASAYLQVWHSLSPGKRERTRSLIAELLRDPEDLKVFLDPWLAVAGDQRTLLSALPPDPRAWERAQRFFADRGDWAGFRATREHWDRLLRQSLLARLYAADRQLERGHLRDARGLYLSVAGEARRDLRDGAVLNTALTRCPPGPVGAETAERLSLQLDWVLERCRFARCPLSATALKRLGRLAGDAAAPQEAMAFLLAGDLAGAFSLERRTEALWSEAWAPYLVIKAHLLTERRRFDEADAALDLVHASWWRRPDYWLARRGLAQAAGETGAILQAEANLRELAAREWPAIGWTWRGGQARLEIFLAEPAGGVEVVLGEVPQHGALIELRLDGAILGMFPVAPATNFQLRRRLRPGLHVLGMESLGGGRVVPGSVRLR